MKQIKNGSPTICVSLKNCVSSNMAASEKKGAVYYATTSPQDRCYQQMDLSVSIMLIFLELAKRQADSIQSHMISYCSTIKLFGLIISRYISDDWEQCKGFMLLKMAECVTVWFFSCAM